MKKYLLFFILFLSVSNASRAQLSGYIKKGFEGNGYSTSPGSPSPNDAQAVSIDVNSNLTAGSLISPLATFKNAGSVAQTFNVTLTSGSYTSTKTIKGLAAGASQQVTFDSRRAPATGSDLVLKAYTSLSGDADVTNDTISKTVHTLNLKTFANMGWVSKQPLPQGRSYFGMTAYSNGTSPNDTAYIIGMGGINSRFISDNSTVKFNTRTNVWSNLANVPGTKRYSAHSFYYNGKIFYIGGASVGGVATDDVSIYNIAANSWTKGAPMLHGAYEYGSCQYNDSLIYIISGFDGNANGTEVQIYNAAGNTWRDGTEYPGIPSDGLRAGVANNKIVVVGGSNRFINQVLPYAYEGIINPLDPTDISWSQIADYPGGNNAFGAGTGIKNSTGGLVYFTAGGRLEASPDIHPQIATWAYNVDTHEWMIGPDKPTAVEYIMDFVPFVLNDTVYIASVGGFNRRALKVNEWLKLGPVSKILTKDSKSSYSEIRTINNNKDNIKSIAASVYPNPSRGLANIVLQNISGSGEEINIRIIDLSGKILKSETKHLDISLSLAYTLSAGTYIIQMQSADGKWKQSQKLVVN